ncbi:MAG: ABC transporter substrate-binding protein [Methanotrichaceae archaeon]|nr:ABC transporter substrate-binding protein [Methanotrichaceae archaeon]
MTNWDTSADYETNKKPHGLPGRIVSLTPSASELICLFGGRDRIVGRDDHSNFPPGMDEKPALGSCIRRTVNVERTLKLNPDLVVTSGHISPETLNMIKASGIPVVAVGGNCDLKGVINNIKLLSGILDAGNEAGELVEFVENYTNLVMERTRNLGIKGKPRVYHECAFKKYKTTATCTSANECIAIAGGINVAQDEAPGASFVSGEWVAASNPDIIISQISTMSPPTVETLLRKRDEIMSRPELKDTSAVRNGQVYINHLSLRRGPRLVGYILHLAKWFHPDLFDDIDPTAVEKELLRKFYGLDLEGTLAYPTI